jgi:polysaccharide biosynthesis protein PslJ
LTSSYVVEHPADLEPSLVARNTYLSRRRFLFLDSALVLILMLCLLDLMPAALIVPGMTDLGRPALIVGVLMFAWWILVRLNPRLTVIGPQPIRWAVLAYWVSILISYAMGYLRGLTAIEVNGTNRALFYAAAFTGVILMVADGVPNWDRLNALLRGFVYCGAFMAVVGLMQFILKYDVTQYLKLPGLQEHGLESDFATRGVAIRVASTAFHYIEFSCVQATTLPFAIHYAMFSQTRRQRRRFLVLGLLIGAAIPVTISRTGILALAAVVLVMVPVWGWRQRYNFLGLAIGLAGVLMVVKPGLLGTVRDLFTNANQDSSVTARTGRYGMVGHYFAQTPWLGRGTGTWIPPQYQILDNYWFTFALGNGLVGVAMLAALHITAITLAVIARRRAATAADRHLCTVLISAQLVALLVAATFDSLSFTTYAMTLAVTVGACGTVWRFTHPERRVRTSAARRIIAVETGVPASADQLR